MFRDRLISEEDRDWFNGSLAKELTRKGLDTTWEVSEFSDILFGDYGTGTPIPDPSEKEYQEIKDHHSLHELLVEYLDEYERATVPLTPHFQAQRSLTTRPPQPHRSRATPPQSPPSSFVVVVPCPTSHPPPFPPASRRYNLNFPPLTPPRSPRLHADTTSISAHK